MDVNITAGKPDEASDALDLDLDAVVAGQTPVYFDTIEDAKPYPVAEKLLALDEISAVLMQEKRITLCRANGAGEWGPIVEQALRTIVKHFDEQPAPEAKRDRSADENELMLAVQNLLNTEINPMVASHGGFIEVVDVRGSSVYLNMSGGCQGCAQSAVTLRQGVERLVAERLPQVTEILDATDHAAGVNPYFQ